MPARPFITYAREDLEIAVWLHAELTAAGAEPWLDAVNLIAGEEWPLAIDRALADATHVIALISARSVDKRGWVQKELRKALALLEEWPLGTIFVIPVRLDESKPRHPMLQRLHWIDLFEDSDASVRRLIAALGIGERARESSEPPMPRLIRGYPDVPSDILVPIVTCSKRLGADLRARGAFVQRELDAWRFMSSFRDPALPFEVHQQIVANLAYSYPDSMTERQLMLPREIQSWRLLQAMVDEVSRATRLAPLIDIAVRAWPRSFAGQYFCIVTALRSLEDGV